jgi:hypothetical protein
MGHRRGRRSGPSAEVAGLAKQADAHLDLSSSLDHDDAPAPA